MAADGSEAVSYTHLTPGVGFGPSGAGYFRLTGFGTREQTEEALERIRKL